MWLHIHNTKKFIGYLAPKLSSLSFISQKTAILLFCLLKHVALTQRSVRRKVVLFPALLHGKRFLSSLQRVTLLFCWLYSKQRFFLWLAKWQRFASFWPGYAVFSIIFVRTAPIAFSLFNCYNTLFSALLHQKHVFALVTVKLGFFQRYCTSKWISLPVFCEWR